MAFNGILDTSYRPDVEALVSLLEQYVTRWAGARTAEARALIEAEALGLFEELVNLDYELTEVRAGDHPEWTELDQFYRQYGLLYRVNIAKLQKLAEMFLQYFNTQRITLLELLGKLKRIRQKRAALTLWEEGEAKFVLADKFLNMDWVDTAFSSEPANTVQPEQGLLSLPVKATMPVLPIRARIGSGSNGVPGNSDTTITQNNGNPEFALNKDVNNWFEYERLDAGPLALSYICEFAREEIINHLAIEPLNLRSGYQFEVVDILFTVSGGEVVSVRDLTPSTLEKDFWTVKSLGNDTSWSISFLPVQAKSVAIKLQQHTSAPIFITTQDGREVARNRWAIALKRVAFNRISYDKAGSLNSVEREYPAGLYGALPFTDVVPAQPELFDAMLEVSLDGGETWAASTNLDDGIGSTVLLSGEAGSLIWRLSLSRDDDAISNVTSFIPGTEQVKEVSSVLRTISKFESPATVVLPEKPKQGKVFAFQAKLGRRGDRFDAITLGNSTTGVSSFQLPFSVLEGGLDPDSVTIYVNRRPYSYQADNTALAPGEWAFSDDLKEIEFQSSLPPNADIGIVFDQERMHFVEKGDGYYHTMAMLFDGDKGNIGIEMLPRTAANAVEMLPRDLTLIQLENKNIVSGSFSLKSRLGTTYTAVTSRAALLATANGYMVDAANGLLWLNSSFDGDTVWAHYQHMSPVTLPQSAFDVVYDGVRPQGIRIRPEAFEACSVVDTIGSSPQARVDVLTGLTTTRTDYVATAANAVTLTHETVVEGTVRVSAGLLGTGNVPEEVAFVDGRSEFLGLIQMQNESTVALTTTGDYVTFNLSAGAAWDTEAGAIFQDASAFANLVADAATAQTGAVGDYFVDGDGLVTVNVGTGGSLAAGIGYTYFYQDTSFDPTNKYSVDYKRGVLYGYRDLVAAETVSYQAGAYKVAYEICQEVDKYEYDKRTNAVSIRTENFSDLNRLVKILWEEASEQNDLRALAPYFSPLISLLAFRFN